MHIASGKMLDMCWLLALSFLVCLMILGARHARLYLSHGKLRQEMNHINSLHAKEVEKILAEKKFVEEKHTHTLQLNKAMDEHIKVVCGDILEKSVGFLVGKTQSLFEKIEISSDGRLLRQEEKLRVLLNPVETSLKSLDHKIQSLEKERVGAYEGLLQQVQELARGHKQLNDQTGHLLQALKTPNVRGKWGEIQLRRLVEISGMLPYCDFYEQPVLEGEQGTLRPDLVVRLPGKRTVAVDSKVPLLSYTETLGVEDKTIRQKKLKEHARHIREHIKKLSKKDYGQHLAGGHDFVLLFLPTETLLIAALEVDEELVEFGVGRNVLVVTPMTLLTLLKTVFMSWRDEVVQENARAIAICGRKVGEALTTFTKEISSLGSSLKSASKSYAQAISTLEERVLPEAQRLGEMTLTPPKDRSLSKTSRSETLIQKNTVSGEDHATN
jgi:DNA recombination protein RmuC